MLNEISVTRDKVLIDGYKHIDLPIGTIIMNAGNNGSTSFGSAFLLCDGRSLSDASYNELYIVIGKKYNLNAPNGFFNLPNFVDRFPMGLMSVDASALPDNRDISSNSITRQGGNSVIQSSQFLHGHAGVTPFISGVNDIFLEGNIDDESPYWTTKIIKIPTPDQVITKPSVVNLPVYYTLNYFIYTGKGVIG